jgi:hypothetical protein
MSDNFPSVGSADRAQPKQPGTPEPNSPDGALQGRGMWLAGPAQHSSEYREEQFWVAASSYLYL